MQVGEMGLSFVSVGYYTHYTLPPEAVVFQIVVLTFTEMGSEHIDIILMEEMKKRAMKLR